MPWTYIRRSIESVIKKAIREFPAVVLTGPRQSGKTTLLTHLFRDTFSYVSLEVPDVRMSAMEDPRGFLAGYPPPVIFDEVQHAPILLPYIKEHIDSQRRVPGQYLLTGSQNLFLMEKVTESLAGWTAVLRLFPLSRREVDKKSELDLPWESGRTRPATAGDTQKKIWEYLVRGFYPEIAADTNRDARLWQAGYVQTYLERDVRNIRQIGDLTQFQVFLRTLASRSAQLLNLTNLSNDIGVAVNTVKAWLSILEASYQVMILRPYYTNIGKRLVKTPKVYFTDVGLLCHLTGLSDPRHAAAGPMGGAIMETAVLMEIVKTKIHRGMEPRVYFWRTAAGSEVDIVVEWEGRLVPLEVKLSSTPVPRMGETIRLFQNDMEGRAASGYVVHPGTVTLPLGPGVSALPFADL
ncbi:MAG: ATP-binding protein [Acidobacteria bacterium]|nr:ATP-binding protein [Acidobacteriota bacterium]